MKVWISAVLFACSLPALPQDDSLGRLFFTPQQRAALDRQRQQGVNAPPSADRQASYTLNGEVRRSSGLHTHWVNGTALGGAGSPRGVIGDTYHPAAGERDKLLGDGRIIVHKAPHQP